MDNTASNVKGIEEELVRLFELRSQAPEAPEDSKQRTKQGRTFNDDEASFVNINEMLNQERFYSQLSGESTNDNKHEQINDFFDEAELMYLQEFLLNLEEDKLMADMPHSAFNEEMEYLIDDIKAALEGDTHAIFIMKHTILKDDKKDVEQIREQLKIENQRK